MKQRHKRAREENRRATVIVYKGGRGGVEKGTGVVGWLEEE